MRQGPVPNQRSPPDAPAASCERAPSDHGWNSSAHVAPINTWWFIGATNSLSTRCGRHESPWTDEGLVLKIPITLNPAGWQCYQENARVPALSNIKQRKHISPTWLYCSEQQPLDVKPHNYPMSFLFPLMPCTLDSPEERPEDTTIPLLPGSKPLGGHGFDAAIIGCSK